jgi:hypothetical protein
VRRTKGIDHLDHARLIQMAEEINPIWDHTPNRASGTAPKAP